METETIVAVASTAAAAVIAVAVPWITFRLALQQDQARWLREQRAVLYADLLTEAYAEQQSLEYQLADPEIQEQAKEAFPDLRLPPLERAQLATRAALFGSKPVNRLFNELQRQGFFAITNPKRNSKEEAEGHRMATRMRVGRVMDELEAAVRAEMGADQGLLPEATRTAQPFDEDLFRNAAWWENRERRRPGAPVPEEAGES